MLWPARSYASPARDLALNLVDVAYSCDTTWNCQWGQSVVVWENRGICVIVVVNVSRACRAFCVLFVKYAKGMHGAALRSAANWVAYDACPKKQTGRCRCRTTLIFCKCSRRKRITYLCVHHDTHHHRMTLDDLRQERFAARDPVKL